MNKTSRQCRKFFFYLINILQFTVIPRWYFRRQLHAKLSGLSSEKRAEVEGRVNYYNKLTEEFVLGKDAVINSSIRPGTNNTYVFDIYRTLRYFDSELRLHYLFGDIRMVPEIPKIVKSRPIEGDNRNSVLMKLNQIRHFYFVSEDIPFHEKKNRVVWRGTVGNKIARINLMRRHAETPICDIGYSKSKDPDDPNHKGFMSIKEQLGFKFILSIEGNDVATNTKWIMSSNSLCLMPKPKFETWFMEGRLIANHHYVLLADDYSDLEEKVAYYIEHPDEALKIIDNAHKFIEPFKNKKQEELILLLVLHRYFQLSKQIPRSEKTGQGAIC